MPGTQPFSLQDAAAYPFVAGVAGALVDIVAVKSIEQSANVDTIENRGDDSVIAAVATLNSLDLTVILGAYTPVSLAVLTGGTVSTTGTGPTSVTKHVRKSNDVVAYFKLVGQTRTKDSDGGAARLTYPKVSWQGGPDFGFKDLEFSEFSISAKAIPDDTTKDLSWYEAYTTWTALA